jgi:hypothetical protein
MLSQDVRNIDIKTVDPAALVFIENVNVDMNLPKRERMIDMLRQMNGNPYFFKSRREGGKEIIVEVGFAKTDVTLDDRLESHLRTI